MAPGVGHCALGAGANAFGNNDFFGLPVPADPQHDIFQALINWVEFGVAPDQVIATKYINDNPASGVAFTRPLCVFPKIARYKGAGDPASASNWSCASGPSNAATAAADAVLSDQADDDRDDRSGDHQ